jgi:serine/threonine protein kinase
VRDDGQQQRGDNVTLDNNVTYSIDRQNPLGKGAQGAVFKAKSADGSLIALKVVLKPSSRDEREYANLVKIQHPNVVKVLGRALLPLPVPDLGKVDCLAIGMELANGVSYDVYLKGKGTIDWQEAAEDFRQLISGMQAVHNQVLIAVHSQNELL